MRGWLNIAYPADSSTIWCIHSIHCELHALFSLYALANSVHVYDCIRTLYTIIITQFERKVIPYPTTHHNPSPLSLRAQSDKELYNDLTVEEVNWSSLSYEMVGVRGIEITVFREFKSPPITSFNFERTKLLMFLHNYNNYVVSFCLVVVPTTTTDQCTWAHAWIPISWLINCS